MGSVPPFSSRKTLPPPVRVCETMTILEAPLTTIQEASAWGIEFVLTDAEGAPEIPSVCKWALHDEASAQKIDNGTMALASTFTVPLTKAHNTLQSTSKQQETRILTLYLEYADPTDSLVIVTRYKLKKTKYLADAIA